MSRKKKTKRLSKHGVSQWEGLLLGAGEGPEQAQAGLAGTLWGGGGRECMRSVCCGAGRVLGSRTFSHTFITACPTYGSIHPLQPYSSVVSGSLTKKP